MEKNGVIEKQMMRFVKAVFWNVIQKEKQILGT